MSCEKKMVKMVMDGESYDIAVYNGMMRFITELTYNKKEKVPDIENACIKDYGDGTISITKQRMIPFDMKDEAIKRLSIKICTEEEALLGEKCTSGRWNIGFEDARYDYLMTGEEQELVK